MVTQKLNVLKFGLAAGIFLGVCMGLTTILSLVGVPGFMPFSQFIESMYGPWGYSISILGIFVGMAYGFAEGFIHFSIFAWIYNKLLK